jgi:hypothetical protein
MSDETTITIIADGPPLIEKLIDYAYSYGISIIQVELETVWDDQMGQNSRDICEACGIHKPGSKTCIQCPLGIFLINQRHYTMTDEYAPQEEIDAYLKKKILALGKDDPSTGSGQETQSPGVPPQAGSRGTGSLLEILDD